MGLGFVVVVVRLGLRFIGGVVLDEAEVSNLSLRRLTMMRSL